MEGIGDIDKSSFEVKSVIEMYSRTEREELVTMSIGKSLSSFSLKRNGAVTRTEEGQKRVVF